MGNFVKTFFLLLLILTVTGCGNNPSITESPAAYNDTIVSILEPVQAAYTALAEGVYTPEGSGASALLQDFSGKADAAREHIDKLPPFKEDTAYLSSAKRLADFYVTTSKEHYPGIVEIVLRDSSSVDDAAFLEQHLMTSLEQERVRFKEFTQSQKVFAEKYDIELVYPEAEESRN